VEQKLAIVLEGIRGERRVSEICREHGISQSQFYRWRDQALEGCKRGLGGSGGDGTVPLKAEVARLQRLVGKQALQIEILKKTEELLGSRG
jgi:transposase-like protein